MRLGKRISKADDKCVEGWYVAQDEAIYCIGSL